MTVHIGSRSWTYYEGGQYPCTCYICGKQVRSDEHRYRSMKPTPLSCCFACMEAGIEPRTYPETGQEVLIDAQTPAGVATAAEVHNFAVNARETAIKRAHEENMESSKQLRNCLALLTTAIVDMTKALREVIPGDDEPICDPRELDREAEE